MKLGNFLLAQLVVLLIAGYGWVMNIIAVVHMAQAADPVTTMFVLRCIGIVLIPLGAVLGYL